MLWFVHVLCQISDKEIDSNFLFIILGERVFPPQSGMTFSTWFCVDKFSSMSDPHPVRLLTLVRNLQGREENLICLSVIMTSTERALIVSTEEHLLPNTGKT